MFVVLTIVKMEMPSIGFISFLTDSDNSILSPEVNDITHIHKKTKTSYNCQMLFVFGTEIYFQ